MEPSFERSIVVGICETQPLTVEGLRSVLAASGGFRMLDPVRSLEEALRQMVTLAPRVTIVDKAFGVPTVVDWLERSRERSLTIPVVWGSVMSEAEALRFLKAGAKGILRKTSPIETVLACLEGVVEGNTWMEEAILRDSYLKASSPKSGLTLREQQVLSLVEEGLRNKEIGRRLGIRPGTVKIHLKHIFEKTGIRGRYGLAISGLRERELALAS